MGVVDEAVATVDEPDRSCLQHVVEVARSLAPDATEGMSYGMPALKLDGKPLVAAVATAKHLSIFPFSSRVVEAVAGRLEGYSLSKGTIRFAADRPVPDDVLADIVRLRMAEIRK
ncbi:uncharacterized protein YdhG (YjbR/CyaY superfamily) [Arthrobacter ulcerisalmonis]|uniref:iron chaperone n=1 Tax=Arthrobacter sp. B1I2 TaxID=3042263 RepID=UPI00278A6446|nr:MULTISPECIES: DUF1801 domain-containing protein [Arthrobacter]MDQ0665512.1 uncharacterized protein YdhG (YjbR/CyaY superfamily) [Arthrobacter ulcerisalmonis]MDQ0729226.1 uncharacterized protein YdhG (YjbR/CyaY superfamily) [Arthrobacter sp. B1I2]